jgi:mRNA interferase MazF
MAVRRFDIWLADLNPSQGTEPGKSRPVVVVQTDLLNDIHPSTIICPVTSKVNRDIQLLRVHLKKGQLDKASDILIDQIRAIDNRNFIKRLGRLTTDQADALKTNLRIVLDL